MRPMPAAAEYRMDPDFWLPPDEPPPELEPDPEPEPEPPPLDPLDVLAVPAEAAEAPLFP